MPTVKCKKCGKEYELEKGEKPSNFQCECGGNLKNKKTNTNSGLIGWWDRQEKSTKAALGVGCICILGLIIILSLFATGAIGGGGDMTTSPTNTTTDTSSDTSSDNIKPSDAKATYHKVLEFSGNGDRTTPVFNIKGSQFRVNITINNYKSQDKPQISWIAYPENNNREKVAEGVLTRSSGVYTKSITPGYYYINIDQTNAESWKIEVFDFY